MFADAEAYERFMGRWSRLVAPPLIEFAKVADAGRVLDVGSGTGSLAFAIASANPGCQVLGIDPSAEYVAYANSRNSAGARVSFEVGDAQLLKQPDGAFESSVSLLVFNFIPDPKKALNEVRRVTKRGGSIAAAVWDYGEGMRMLRLFWDAVVSTNPSAEKLDERHMKLCRSGELAALWSECGLSDVQQHPIDVTTRFTSFADYWDPFLLGQGPAGAYVRTLDDAGKQKLRSEVRRLLGVQRDDAPINLTARVWAVRGRV